MRLEIFHRRSYRSGAADCAADRPLLRHPPRWHHQHRGIRSSAPRHTIISTAAYDVNVPFMQLEQHGWDIHAV
jgi:hypothetical protein